MHALEKEMATHSSVLAWRIPGTEEPGGLLSMGSHRVRHDRSDLAAAAAALGKEPMHQGGGACGPGGEGPVGQGGGACGLGGERPVDREGMCWWTRGKSCSQIPSVWVT